MKNLVTALLGLFLITSSYTAQCDVAISSWDAVTGDISIEAINSENCGCNEFTTEGNTCETSGSPYVNNNETISHIVLGLHVEGLDYNWGCTGAVNHPGWTFKAFTLFGNQVLESGDTWSANVYDSPTSNDCWAEILANDSLCTEIVVWQINLSRTASTDEGGWAVNGGGALQTQNYPDIDLSNNSFIVCPVVFPGCTDPFALNYNEEATEDDGTCVFSQGPDPIIIDLVVNNEDCEVFEAGVLSTFEYAATIVNIGTEAVTYFCLNDFLGITFNCFNGVSNLAVWIQPGDTITVYGSINVDGTWFAGQGNFMTITSVPGEIITGNNNFVFYMPNGVDCEEIVDPEPCDTVYIDNFIIDTLYVNVIDTLYIDNYITLTDTIIEYVDVEWITYDTVYVDVIVDNYVYLIDTLTIIETQLIDCETGEECIDPPGISECWPWTVYIPNTFTPNNDGLNDTWQIIYDLDCWVDVEFKIFNRWGEMIYHGYDFNFSSYPFWDGSVNGGGYYASDGVYLYTFYGRRSESPEILEESGHITIFR
tara:strand:+ start:1894 stop:3504 length:1611 start_codon:yes stop_codon:yes gene_type:complete